MCARLVILTDPASVPGNASRELLVLGQRTHSPERDREGREGKRGEKEGGSSC